MIRILFFIALVFALGAGFSWLADRPGDLVMTIGGTRYETSVMVAAVAVAVLIAAIMIVWWVLKSIWNSPRAMGRYFRARKRDRGYQALSTGMIAAGAGDTALARRMTGQAGKLLDSTTEPLLQLLDAQSLLLEGNHEAARSRFEAMIDDPETRILGLRGLYLEAQRLADPAAARHYAFRAAEIAPQLEWATNASLEFEAGEGNWDRALGLVETQRSTRQIDKETASRRRAVLLTAKAMEEFDTDQAGARSAALEANRLAPDLVPAAIVAARILFRNGELRKGSKILETAWRKEPHPEVAETYIHARPGDSAADRLKRAENLERLKPHNVESLLAVARAAYDANEFDTARKSVESALRMEPREGAYLLLADIEEAETADQGRIRFWLSKAVRAPRDPAWTADGHVSENWAPVSPVTGRLDAFEWRVPVEQIGPVVDAFDKDAPPALTITPDPNPKRDGEPVAKVTEARKSVNSTDKKAAVKDDTGTTVTEPEDIVLSEDEASEEESGGATSGTGDTAKIIEADEISGTDETNADFPARPPDDPGVSKDEKDEAPRRFRLF